MQKLRWILAVSFIAAYGLGAGAAWAADWRLVEVSGVVRVARPGQQPAPASANEVVPAGSTVTTAAGGRAALFNGAQRMTLAPNSRMTVTPENAGGMVRIIQDLGSVLFQVDKKPNPHFRVETPLLAAVVKGTTFTVSVDLQQASVHVAEGLVEVRANQGAAVQDVAPGVTGTVSRDAPGQIGLIAPTADLTGAPPVTAPALDYGTVSNGLVDGPGAPAPAMAAGAAQARAQDAALADPTGSAPALDGRGAAVALRAGQASRAELGDGGRATAAQLAQFENRGEARRPGGSDGPGGPSANPGAGNGAGAGNGVGNGPGAGGPPANPGNGGNGNGVGNGPGGGGPPANAGNGAGAGAGNGNGVGGPLANPGAGNGSGNGVGGGRPAEVGNGNGGGDGVGAGNGGGPPANPGSGNGNGGGASGSPGAGAQGAGGGAANPGVGGQNGGGPAEAGGAGGAGGGGRGGRT